VWSAPLCRPTKADLAAQLHQMNGLARRPHADFDLRAYRHPLEELGKSMTQVMVALVAPIVTHLFAQQTH